MSSILFFTLSSIYFLPATRVPQIYVIVVPPSALEMFIHSSRITRYLEYHHVLWKYLTEKHKRKYYALPAGVVRRGFGAEGGKTLAGCPGYIP
jgi:hypothetical protein